MKKIAYEDLPKELLDQLSKGAFLTVKDKDGNLNTMTIGWGALGYMWHKPVFMVMVRKSRYTFDMIEGVDEFTVSFPFNNKLKKELMICGTKSKRDVDKFELCNLTPEGIEDFNTPVIKGCDLHLMCKIIYKQALSEDCMTEQIKEVYGAEKDYHTLYYGEIITSITSD